MLVFDCLINELKTINLNNISCSRNQRCVIVFLYSVMSEYRRIAMTDLFGLFYIFTDEISTNDRRGDADIYVLAKV